MLSRCANSQCSKPFLRLREGGLFLAESEHVTKPQGLSGSTISLHRKPSQRVEHLWSRDRCASVWTLIQNGRRGIALLSLVQPAQAGDGRPETSCHKIACD